MNKFMATPIDNTKDGECSQCGRCCSAILPVNPNQILRIKKYLKKHPEIKPHNYTPILSKDFMDICPFLSEDKKCMIYEVRPSVCEHFSCARFKDPNYKPMDYRQVKLINMFTTFSDEPCPQAPNLDGLNEILEDQKERAYGKKNVR